MIHLVFDTETLDLKESSVVATLGCVAFDFKQKQSFRDIVNNGFFVKFDIKEQIKEYKRTTNKDTIDWWRKQSQEAKDLAIFPSDHDRKLKDGLTELKTWIKNSGYDFKTSFVWSRGSYFDFPKIEDLYRNIGERAPFNTFKIRDTRTMIDVLTGSDDGHINLKNPDGFIHHHSLHDAAFEAVKMKYIFDKN